MNEAFGVAVVLITAGLGLLAPNLLYDRGLPGALSRCVGAALGGLAFLLAVLLLHPWTAVLLSFFAAASIAALRLCFRRGLRGVRGVTRSRDWSEITFPVSASFSLLAGWALLDDRWLAFVPIAFVAWGDNAAGFTRAFARNTAKPALPSLAMFGVCLALAAFVEPYRAGAAAAAAATLLERYRPETRNLLDDNWLIVSVSFLVIAALTRLSD